MRIYQKDVTCYRIAGGWILQTIYNGHLVSRKYYGYTKRQSLRLFVKEMNCNA